MTVLNSYLTYLPQHSFDFIFQRLNFLDFKFQEFLPFNTLFIKSQNNSKNFKLKFLRIFSFLFYLTFSTQQPHSSQSVTSHMKLAINQRRQQSIKHLFITYCMNHFFYSLFTHSILTNCFIYALLAHYVILRQFTSLIDGVVEIN